MADISQCCTVGRRCLREDRSLDSRHCSRRRSNLSEGEREGLSTGFQGSFEDEEQTTPSLAFAAIVDAVNTADRILAAFLLAAARISQCCLGLHQVTHRGVSDAISAASRFRTLLTIRCGVDCKDKTEFWAENDVLSNSPQECCLQGLCITDRHV